MDEHDGEGVSTDLFMRTCEVFLLDAGDHEVRCRRSAQRRLSDWWMCARCALEGDIALDPAAPWPDR